jgi:hypothetical protein
MFLFSLDFFILFYFKFYIFFFSICFLFIFHDFLVLFNWSRTLSLEPNTQPSLKTKTLTPVTGSQT